MQLGIIVVIAFLAGYIFSTCWDRWVTKRARPSSTSGIFTLHPKDVERLEVLAVKCGAPDKFHALARALTVYERLLKYEGQGKSIRIYSPRNKLVAYVNLLRGNVETIPHVEKAR